MKEALKKHKKVVVFVAAIIIIIICCIAGYMAKIKYEQKQEKIRLEKIEATNNKIKKEYDDFTKEEEREKKLELLKNLAKEADEYGKSDEKFDICEKEYLNKIDQMKNYFIEDYDKTIDDISAKVGDINSFNNREDLSSYVTALNDLKTTIQSEYENYNVLDEEKFNTYSNTIDTTVASFNDRIASIEKEEEAARIAAEEEAKRQAEEAAKNSNNGNGSSSSGNSNYSDSNSGSSSNSYSSGGSSNSYSGGSSSSVQSSSSSGSGNISGSGWVEDPDGTRHNFTNINGDIYDENGNYEGNIDEWLDNN